MNIDELASTVFTDYSIDRLTTSSNSSAIISILDNNYNSNYIFIYDTGIIVSTNQNVLAKLFADLDWFELYSNGMLILSKEKKLELILEHFS